MAAIRSSSDLLTRSAELTNQAIRRFLAADKSPPKLHKAIGYSLLAGGKRLRPALVLSTFYACGGKGTPAAVRAAMLAVEMIHTFSLIHDDLPAMDDDDLRRGKPTSHKVFGEALAILAGDALNTAAFQILVELPDKQLAAALVLELTSATAGTGMIGGQVLDIESEGTKLSLKKLQEVHALKTGALLTASCRMGALCASASKTQLKAITRYGQHLGLTFQITDDILDETSTPEQLGKATGKDAARGKNTYPGLLGLAESRKAATRHAQEAAKIAKSLGTSGQILFDLANFVVSRTS